MRVKFWADEFLENPKNHPAIDEIKFSIVFRKFVELEVIQISAMIEARTQTLITMDSE